MASGSVEDMRITVADCSAGLAKLESSWASLFASQPSAHLANSPAYLWAAATASPVSGEWRCWLAEGCKGPVAGLFGRKQSLKVFGLPVPVFSVGTEFVGDPLLSPYCDDASLADLLLRILDSQTDVALVQFGRVSETGFENLSRAALRCGLRKSWSHAGIGYYWHTETNSEPSAARLTPHARRELGRTERNLQKALDVRFEVVATRDPQVNTRLLQEFIELESAGWKGKEGTSIKHRPGNARYFHTLVEQCGREGWMRWYKLHSGGRAIAMNLGIQTHDTVWILKTAYDESFFKHRPGQALLHATLDHCISEPSVVRCNMIGSPAWLDPWNPSRQRYYSLRIFCPNPPGVLLYLGDHARKLVQSSARRAAQEASDKERRFL